MPQATSPKQPAASCLAHNRASLKLHGTRAHTRMQVGLRAVKRLDSPALERLLSQGEEGECLHHFAPKYEGHAAPLLEQVLPLSVLPLSVLLPVSAAALLWRWPSLSATLCQAHRRCRTPTHTLR